MLHNAQMNNLFGITSAKQIQWLLRKIVWNVLVTITGIVRVGNNGNNKQIADRFLNEFNI